MRQLWLQNLDTKMYWNLLPKDPYSETDDLGNGASPLLSISGMGYQQSITQNQVGVDYFISQVSSKNTPVTGTMTFLSDDHIKAFQAFVGDFRKQMRLYYSPSGKFEVNDEISSIYYKDVIISQISKTEKTQYGDYECAMSFTPQTDVWKRNFIYPTGTISETGEALVYPYTYPYVYSGKNTLSLVVNNQGRETGCVVRIKNTGENTFQTLEWFCEQTFTDSYNVQHTDVQKSKWFVSLASGNELVIDSNALTQECIVKFPDGTSQNVVSQQEPSWEYINFIQLIHGQNRFVFFLPTTDISIVVEYAEQKEIV